MGNNASGGPFSLLVVQARNVIGKKRFNKLRGKAISLHSQGILDCQLLYLMHSHLHLYCTHLLAITCLLILLGCPLWPGTCGRGGRQGGWGGGWGKEYSSFDLPLRNTTSNALSPSK